MIWLIFPKPVTFIGFLTQEGAHFPPSPPLHHGLVATQYLSYTITGTLDLQSRLTGMDCTTITRKMVPITVRASSVLEILCTYVRFQKQNRKEKRRRQNNNRLINLPQGNNIVHILRVHHLTLNFIIHIYQNYIYIQ